MSNKIGNQNGIDGIGFALSDLCTSAPSVRLNGIDNENGEFVLLKKRVKGNPIVSRGFHADKNLGRVVEMTSNLLALA